jgi:hypothetical protein
MELGSGDQEGRSLKRATFQFASSSSTSFLFRCPFANRFPENRVVGGTERLCARLIAAASVAFYFVENSDAQKIGIRPSDQPKTVQNDT